MIKKISQSFIKDMREYLAPNSDMCGHLIRHKWIDEKLIKGSAAMKLGSYVEYRLTGALPKDKIIPIAERTQAGKLTADYERAEMNVRRIKNYLDLMGLVIEKAGQKLTKGRYQGTIDIIAIATKKIVFQDGYTLNKGDRIIIDMKYSGLLDDRWSKHGWAWTDEQKAYHGTQAIQYHFVGGLPFFFLVCHSKNTVDIKFFRVEISEHAIERHIIEGNELYGQLEMINLSEGFIARPSVSKCTECPLKISCPDRHDFPHAQLVTI